jgi:hypothetical protein
VFTQIFQAYYAKSKLNRAQFLLGLAVSYLLIALLMILHHRINGIAAVSINFLIIKSAIEGLFYLLISPLIIARLRDIGWPSYLVVFLYPVWLFGSRNLVLYQTITETAVEADFVSKPLVWVGTVFTLISIGLILILIIKQSRNLS